MDHAKARIVLIHGTGEHSGRYEHVARRFNRHGFSVLSGDLPGWGKSPGLRGHIDTFDEYVRAVETWVDDALSTQPDGPLFVMGHSLGGLVAVRFVQQYSRRRDLSGLILSSPCLKLKLQVPRWKVGLAAKLNLVWPTLRLANGISPHHVTRDEEIRQQYRTDRLNYHKVSVRWFCELLREMDQARLHTDRLDIPLLVVQAGEDKLVDPEGGESIVRYAQTSDKQFLLFPGLYHEVLNEPEREQVFNQILHWLARHTFPGSEK